MTKLPILSIIIPVYNVENYISECLDSVCNQDFEKENYEIICVDDGSTDNSNNIIVNYQKKYDNIILISHESNKKLGVARNTGRSVAKGKYIWNIDSDDYIKPNILKDIIEVCETNNLDVLMFNFDHLINSKETLNQSYPFKNSEVLTGLEFLNKYCLNNFAEISPVWTQIYRRDFLDKKNIYSPPNNLGEDIPYTMKTLLLAGRIKSITKSYYIYRLNQNSIGGIIEIKPTSAQLREKCFDCAIDIYEVIKLIPESETRIKAAYYEVCKYVISSFNLYLKKLTDKEYSIFKSSCRMHIFRDLKVVRLLSKNLLIIYIFTIIIPFSKRK